MEGNTIHAGIMGGGGNDFSSKTSLAVMSGWCLSI